MTWSVCSKRSRSSLAGEAAVSLLHSELSSSHSCLKRSCLEQGLVYLLPVSVIFESFHLPSLISDPVPLESDLHSSDPIVRLILIMATKAAHKRLTREYAAIQSNPLPYISAHPSESNILEWHYILTGAPDTPYLNGQFWGTLVFPPEYPFAPPAIRMHTPYRPLPNLHQTLPQYLRLPP